MCDSVQAGGDAPRGAVLVGSRILRFDGVGSTNDIALEDGGDGVVVVADCQTAGRGRHGHSWHSAPGLGLWFSVGLEGPPDGLMFAGAVSVRDALEAYGHPRICWPNDIFFGDRKVCGILVEHRGGRSALGIGLNVHHAASDFPKGLRTRACSLAMVTDAPLAREAILREVLTHLDRVVMLIRGGAIGTVRDAWAAACDIVGRRVRYGHGEGLVRRVAEDGALVVETANGPERVLSGGVTVVGEG